MKRRFLIPILIILIPIAGFLLFLTAAQVLRYRPASIKQLEADPGTIPGEHGVVPTETALRILNWNIGYAGLDAGSDFVMDGGTQGLPESRGQVEKNLQGITTLVKNQEAEFYLFQEVDLRSKRSYKIDQTEILRSLKPAFINRFAMNFKVFFIPFPIYQPIGRVRSGLLTLSQYEPAGAERHQLPGDYSWPTRLFMLRRCISVLTFETDIPGRIMYLVNVHLSAYDDGGMRKGELEYVKNWMMELYKEGHYIILGGDWNSLFPEVGFDDFTPYTTTEENLFWIQKIPDNWTPDNWQWGWDPEVPSCRTLDKPYTGNENFRTIIDGFLVSPNIRIQSIRTFDEDFAYSDHNPVSLDFQLLH